MDKGFVKLSREIIEHELWKSDSFSRGQAWVDLIILASWKDSRFYIRGNRVEVGRGQLGYSIKKLADRWGWSRGKVKRFLNELQNDHQIEQQNTPLTTLITITNYEKYQSKRSADRTTDEASDRTTDGQQTDTLEEVKEVKRNNKGRFTPPSVDEVRDYCKEKGYNIDAEYFVSYYGATNWMRGKAKIKSWKLVLATWNKNNKNENHSDLGIVIE